MIHDLPAVAGAFIAATSDREIRPLLCTMLEMADRLAESALDPDQLRLAEILRSGARALERVLEDALELSRFG